MNGHDVIWSQPPSLLTNGSARVLATPRDAYRIPAILRFATDSFMDDFLNVLQTSPERLRDYQVRRETWRGFTPPTLVEAAKSPSLVRQRLGIFQRARSSTSAVATQPTIADAVAAGAPLKLYQPAHQRHYLVASSLVCNVTGLPDRVVTPGNGEKTACVVRRLLPSAGDPTAAIDRWEEHGWVAGQTGNVWQHVGADPERLVDGEERLPMFAVHFAEPARRARRVFAGVVPVGKREAYLGAPKSNGGASPGITPRTARKVLLRKEVIEPWKSLVRRAQDANRSLVGPFRPGDRAPNVTERAARLKIERAQIQTVSWFILLDFARYLSMYLKPVWRAVLDPTRRPAAMPEQVVFDAIDGTTLSDTLRERLRHTNEVNAGGDEICALDHVPVTLRAALAAFGTAPEMFDQTLERQLDAIDQAYDRGDSNIRALWPGFLFPLADPDLPGDAPVPPVSGLRTFTTEEQTDLALDEVAQPDDPLELIDKLGVLIVRALQDDDPGVPQPAVPTAAIAPANALDGWFVMRCVYERPACEPVHGEVMSAPTEPFQMAGFFDPDAPARPIRIGLPVDTTPAGLRKFDKNTAFVISDTLCGQIRRMKGLTFGDLVLSVLPWPFHKDLAGDEGGPCKTDGGLSLGMICSLSIPIITLCALILLIIMVSLFDIIFRWLPYFIICFPIPGLKAKKT
jgi:uncharacterized protein (DUF934 family)